MSNPLHIGEILMKIHSNIPKDEIIKEYSEKEYNEAVERACEYYIHGGCTKEGFSPDPRDVGATVYGACDGCNGSISLGTNSNCEINEFREV